MKIIINVSYLTNGGAERVAADLANGLSKRGHHIIVLTDLQKRVSYQLDKTVDVRHFNSRRITSCFKSVWEYSRIIKQERPDAVLGFGSYQSFLAKASQFVSGVKAIVVYTEHNVLERPKGVKFPLREKFYKFYFSRFCDAMTVLTQADKNYAQQRLKNLYVMPNPMSLVPVSTPGVKENTILAVGRLNVWYVKGFDLLLKAWGCICHKYADWTLKIIGAGNENDEKRLIAFAQDSCCDKQFELLPYTDNIAPAYQKASIFALSSRYEGFGLVLTEAMSQGCACIAADYKGRQGEIINNGINGLLCPTESAEAIANQLERLIDDEHLRRTLQINAIERSKDFLVESYAEKWENLLIHLKNKTKKNV